VIQQLEVNVHAHKLVGSGVLELVVRLAVETVRAPVAQEEEDAGTSIGCEHFKGLQNKTGQNNKGQKEMGKGGKAG